MSNTHFPLWVLRDIPNRKTPAYCWAWVVMPYLNPLDRPSPLCTNQSSLKTNVKPLKVNLQLNDHEPTNGSPQSLMNATNTVKMMLSACYLHALHLSLTLLNWTEIATDITTIHWHHPLHQPSTCHLHPHKRNLLLTTYTWTIHLCVLSSNTADIHRYSSLRIHCICVRTWSEF